MARQRVGSRGVKVWAGLSFDSVTIGMTQALIASFVTGTKSTILRMRGELLLSGIPNAAGDSDVLGLGVMLVSDQALAAGGVSLPGPIANPDAGWIWHQYVLIRSEAASAVSDVALGIFSRITLDSKAMRKVGPNQAVALIGEATTGEFGSVSVLGGMRLLSLAG